MSNARLALAGAVTVDCVFAGSVEGLPRNLGRVIDPRFFRLRVATGGLSLLDYGSACVRSRA